MVGLTSAIALKARGVAVTLITDEPHWASAASWGNAGHIATEQTAPLASLASLRRLPQRLFSRGGAAAFPARAVSAWLPFGVRLLAASGPARFARGQAALSGLLAGALPAWRLLLGDAAAGHLLGEDGHFLVWETARSAARGRAFWAAQNIGTASFRGIDPAEQAQLALLVRRPLAGGIRFAGTGRINDLGALEAALRRHFAALGGTWRQGHVRQVAAPDGAVVQLADGTALRADAAVVAAGARSAALLAPLGINVPLIAERGYHIEADAPDWPADLPPVVFENRGMIVTRFAHGLRAASFTEFAHADTPADPRKWARLEAHAAALGLPIAAPRRWMGARPTLPDYLPAIGRLRQRPVYCAFGHQHLGLTLAAISAQALAAQIAGDAAGFDLRAFDVQRFAP